MRCSAYCVASSIKLQPLANFLRSKGLQTHIHNDVAYSYDIHTKTSTFYFVNGTIVIWNNNKHSFMQSLSEIESFFVQPVKNIERDHYAVHYGDKTIIKPHEYFNVEMLTLENDDVEIKLAISYGFSQSIKIQFFNKQVEQLSEKYSPIIANISSEGHIQRLSRKKVTRMIGEIFLVKSLVNLKGELLSVPKFFWRHPGLEKYYVMLENYLDLSKRVEILNYKLDTLNEVFYMLNEQLSNQHSHFLEWVIIVLILIEVLIAIFA